MAVSSDFACLKRMIHGMMARLSFVAVLCWFLAFAGTVSAALNDDGSGSGADRRERPSAEMVPQADSDRAALVRDQMALCSAYQNCDPDDMGDNPTENEKVLNWHRLAALVDTDAITSEHLPDTLPPTPLSAGLRGEGWVPGPQDWNTAAKQKILCRSAGYERCDPSKMGHDVLENEYQLEFARCLSEVDAAAITAATAGETAPARNPAAEVTPTTGAASDGNGIGDQAGEPADGSANRTDSVRSGVPQERQAQPSDMDTGAEAERRCRTSALPDDPESAIKVQLALCFMPPGCPLPPFPNIGEASPAELERYLEGVSRWLSANRQSIPLEVFEEVNEARDQVEAAYKEWRLQERTAVNDARTAFELVERAFQGLHEKVQAVVAEAG